MADQRVLVDDRRPAPLPQLRVGNDVCRVDDVVEAISTFGDRYLERVFTGAELDYARRAAPLVTAQRLAARFAAKEAFIKVLRPAGARPDWREIEVQRQHGGWCELVLHGSAAVQAAAAGVTDLVVSLSHERDAATAVVVAHVQPPACGVIPIKESESNV